MTLAATMPRPSPRIRLFACAAALFSVALAAGGAQADAGGDAVDKITKLNKRGIDEYENLNFDEAQKLLRAALDVASQAGLDNRPAVARTYVHLGVVLFAGFKQKDDALTQFRKALHVQSDIKLDKTLANPEIQAVFDEAVDAEKAASAAAAKPAAPPELAHDPVTHARQAAAIPINVTVDAAAGVKKMVLSFNVDGSDDFAERPMREVTPGNWTADIPASATTGSKVGYYIDASGADDQVVASKGSADSPLVISLVAADGRRAGAAVHKKAEPPPPTTGPSWFIGLGVGSGFGWTTGFGEVNSQDKIKPAGFEPSELGQVLPEVGYFLAPRLLLSVQFRLQLVTGPTPFYDPGCPNGVCSPASYALAGFGRLTWLFGDGDLHPYVAGTAGIGTIRHVATFASVPNCGKDMMTTCVDTVASGPVFVGGAGGIFYDLTPSFALTLGVDTLVGFTKFTFQVDGSLGVAVKL